LCGGKLPFRVALTQSGANTLITLGPHNVITLDNVAADSLTLHDFALHGKVVG